MHKYGLFERLALPLALLVLVVGLVLVYRDGSAYDSAERQAGQTEAVISSAAALVASLTTAETGQRGFLLTGREEYLHPYRSSLNEVRRQLGILQSSVRLPENRARMPRLQELVHAKLTELDSTIDLRRRSGPEAALQVVLTDEGKAYMDEIRRICAEIERGVRGRMIAAHQEVSRSARNLRWFSTGSLLILCLLLTSALVIIGGATVRRQDLIRDLDISRREAAQARDTLKLTLQSIGDAVISTNNRGEIVFLNPEAVKLTGWEESSAVGQPLSQVFRIINEHSRNTVESPVEKVLQLGAVVGLANHTLLVSRNGREIPIDDSAAPIHGTDGELLGVVLIFRDITERRRAERLLEEKGKELSRSNQALVRSNTDLEQFAYAVSHDLQEPLRTIASFTQLFEREAGTPRAKESAEYVLGGIRRLTEMIRDLLEYSRVKYDADEGRQPVRMQDVAEEVRLNLQGQIADSNAVVRAEALPTVTADRTAMVQLLQNLVGNALKYAGSSRPEVEICAEHGDGDRWVFHVRDNGIGIDMQYADQIFGVFKRLHGRDEYTGTGIGLAICKRIVELHGGTIWVESSPGAGSTFSFTMPGSSRNTA